MRMLARAVLKAIYGVRGGLKPPIGGPYAGPLYPIKYRWWRMMSRAYQRSGLPQEWRRRIMEQEETNVR